MRIPSTYLQPKARGRYLTPIFHCAALLLIGFLCKSLAIVEHSSLLPKVDGRGRSERRPLPAAGDFDKVAIRVLAGSAGPAWQLNGVPFGSPGELRQTLTAIARIQDDVPVILEPDGEVPLGDVIDLFDLVSQCGFARIQFAVHGG